MLQKTKQRCVETVQRNYDVLVSRTADGLENKIGRWLLVVLLPIAGILASAHFDYIGMQPLPLILSVLTFAHVLVVLDSINEFKYRDNGIYSHD